MKFNKQIISETAQALHLSDNQILDIAYDLWEDAFWSSFNMDELIEQEAINFGLPILIEPQNREAVEKLVKHVRKEFRKYYNDKHSI